MGKRFTQFLVLGVCLFLGAGLTLAQMTTTGRMIGTVTDPTGAVVAGADVKATDEATGKTYETKSSSDGGFVFSNLQPGSYTVTVAMQGFKKAEVRAVKIVVGGQRGLTVQLELGEMASTVVIEAGTEILQTSETKVGTTITGKAITSLPFTSRDALDLAILMPGASTVGRPRATSFMGLPKGAMNITMDGINAQDNVLKSSDGFFTLIRPRVDSMEEFSISTAAAGANETGEGAVQIRFETKRGTNEYHGGAWWYHRNDKFNSNYYFNNEVAPGSAETPKQRQRLNQFGLKVGGPIIKEKLFFFTAFDFYRNPESRSRTRTILTNESSAGIFRYAVSSIPGTLPAWVTCGPTVTPGTTGNECAANLLQMAAASGFPSSIDLTMGGYIAAVNTVVGVPGVSILAPPSRYQRSIRFNNGGAGRRNFPDFRFDYNLNKNHLITAIYHYNYFTSTPDFLNSADATYPVAPFNANAGSQISNRNQLTAAWRWNIGTTKTNEVRVGLVSSPVAFFPDLKINLYPQINTNLGTLRANPGFSGMNSPLLGYNTQGRNGGIMQLIDTFGWSWGKHNFSFGGNMTYTYWKGYFDSAAVGSVGLGIASTDPAFSGINWASGMPGSNSTDQGNARGIYGMLIGRVTSFGAAAPLNFDTRQFQQGIRRLLSYYQNEFAFYATDNWRLFSTLTMNVGVRWEIQPSADTKSNFNELFRVRDGLTGLAGRSCSLDRLFQPGSATCAVSGYEINNNADWWATDWNAFAPSLGLAWTPNLEGDVFKWIFGGPAKSVFRVGYSIAYTREGMNNFSSIAGANPGFTSSLASSAVGPPPPGGSLVPGQFLAGSVMLSDGFIPNVTGTPPSFVESFSLSPQTASQSLNMFDPNLQIPYVQSWQVGWQREITPSTVVEVRYVGNHGTGLWRQFNWNEVNAVETGFLTEFRSAANNLALCRANPTACIAAQQAAGVSTANRTADSFANWGLSGQAALPIMTGGFAGVTSTGPPTASGTNGSCAPPSGGTASGQCNANFRASARVLNLVEGQAGSFAATLSGTLSNWNNLVAAGFPANFWVLNPDARGGIWIMGNSSHTTYNGLQLEVRRKPVKGLQYSGSYVFSKSLTDYFGDSAVSAAGFSTLRDRGYNKGASPWDLRHNFKLQLIYEMPFGPGRRWSSSQGWLNRIIEGWEINTITRWQSGRVFLLSGGLGGTFNANDGGVELIGINAQQIQNQLQIRKEPDGRVFFFPAEMIGSDGRANTSIMRPCQTAGQFCQRLFLYGPSFFRPDWSIAKRTKISEKVNIEYRAEFLNAFNNINFFFGGSAAVTVAGSDLRSTSFGRVTDSYQDTSTTDDPGGRLIQMVLRINF